jgi:hypothetical protein
MTAKRLNEIKKKFENNTGEIKDLNEILSDLFLSNGILNDNTFDVLSST